MGWILGAVVAVGLAGFEPPSVEDVRTLAAWYESAPERFDPARDGSPPEYLARVSAEVLERAGDPAEWGFEHFEPLLGTNIFYYAEEAGAYLDRLQELAAEPTVDGARAAIGSLAAAGKAGAERQGAVLDTVLDHPEMDEVLREPGGWSHFFAVWYLYPRELGPERAERIAAAAVSTPDEPTVHDVLGGLRLLDWLGDGPEVDATSRERLRQALRVLTAAARAHVRDDDPQYQNLSLGGATPSEYLDSQLVFLGSAASGEGLEGLAAPEIEFAWRSEEGLPEALSGLRGKVVVLDFFATWCGPCIASFPEIARVAERFAGEPVVVIGVTSVQGFHMSRENGRVDTEGDPAREMELMREFMGEHGVTWPVVFATQDVFNPEYGVRGVPHLAVIGADGVVRGNGVGLEELERVVEEAVGEVGTTAP